MCKSLQLLKSVKVGVKAGARIAAQEAAVNNSPPQEPREEDSQVLWCVYDRHLDPLHLASTLTEAEAWALAHWRAAKISDGDEVDPHDYSYLLSAVPKDTGDGGAGLLANIIRQERVDALRRRPRSATTAS